MTRRYQTASWGALARGFCRGQAESSREGDSPWGTSPEWKCHAPTGREFSISTVCSFAIAAGERFFCSRMGVKDWAKAMEQVSANASGRCLRCMGARVANLRAFEKSAGEFARSCLRTEGLTRIFTDDTDQERAAAGSSSALLTKCREHFVQDDR